MKGWASGCGYQLRFDRQVSDATAIRFVTEGLLLRQLAADPQLPGVSTVILDEFHERHLEGDLLIALLRRLQESTRPELRLVVMSATLDAGSLRDYLGCPTLRAEGRRYPVTLAHLDPPRRTAQSSKPGRTDQVMASRFSRGLDHLAREGIIGPGAPPGHVPRLLARRPRDPKRDPSLPAPRRGLGLSLPSSLR